MGMFDKDKEIGLLVTNFAKLGEPFIVWSARIIREDFPTKMGLAVQSGLEVSKLTTPRDRYGCTTLASAIGAKVKEAEGGDFPAVVQLLMVESKFGRDALVLQFLKPYGGAGSPAPTAGASSSTDEDDDIPF